MITYELINLFFIPAFAFVVPVSSNLNRVMSPLQMSYISKLVADRLRKRKLLSIVFCQCLSLARCRYRLFGIPFLVSFTELSSIDIKDIASFIKLSGWFTSVGLSCF